MIQTLLATLFCASALGVPLNQKMSDTFYGLAVNQTIDSMVAQRLQLQSYLTAPLTPDWHQVVVPTASSVGCQKTLQEVQRIQTSLETLIEDPMTQLDARGTAVQVRMEDLRYLERQLVGLHGLLGSLELVSKTLKSIPVVGPVFTTLSVSLQVFRDGVVTRMKKTVQSFNQRVLDKIEPKLEKMLEQNAHLAEKLAIAKFVLYEHVVKPLCVADKYCPLRTRETVCTGRLTGQLTTTATHLEEFTDRLDDLAQFVKDLDIILLRVSRFLQDPGYTKVMEFLEMLGDKLAPFLQFLDKKITLRVAVPDVCVSAPCPKMCRRVGIQYPCGVKSCLVCTPTLGLEHTFTVRQIANGIGALSDLFMDAVKKILPKLPDLTIPGFPKLPDLPLLSIPDLDISVDLPTLGFGCLTGGPVATDGGIPRGLHLGSCFGALPAIHC